MKDKKIIMIFIDAFSSRYLSKDCAPFLYELHQKGNIRFIDPLPAFEGIGATVFSGTWPETNGIWTNFIKKEKSSFNPESRLFKVFDLLPNDRIAWDMRYITYKLLKRSIPMPNLIPPNSLKFFEPKLKSSIFKDNILGDIPTLFDVIRREKRSINFIKQSLFGNDEKILKSTLEYIRKGNLSHLTYLKFGSLDLIGHKYGPVSQKTLDRVRFTDDAIAKIIEEGSRQDQNVSFLLFSDHGMAPVFNNVDLLGMLRKIPLKMGKDYLVFLDSTMARFWFNCESGRRGMEDLLSELNMGSVLSDEKLKKAKLPVNREEYGELIYALKEGYVFRPDFFHRNMHIMGMHSYFISEYDHPIFAIHTIDGDKIKEDVVRFVDIMPTVLELLELPLPSSCVGRSVIL